MTKLSRGERATVQEHQLILLDLLVSFLVCSDASALGGGAAALLPVHETESGGVPKLHTSATATAEPSLGERIKEGIGGMFHKAEPEAGGEAHAARGTGESSVSGAHAQKPGVIDVITEKVKETLHLGQ